MISKLSARDEMLQRIQVATHPELTGSKASAAWQQLPRAYRIAASISDAAAVTELFIERLRDYDADVTRCAVNEGAMVIGEVLRERAYPRMLLPPGFSQQLLPDLDLIMDDGFSPAELDLFDGVLTEATLGIAETGTLILQNVPGQGRRAATLVPDFHLCVLKTADIVATVPEAILRLAPTASLPTTFVSGPSATADIEMTRIKGVHGPRFLHVLLLD